MKTSFSEPMDKHLAKIWTTVLSLIKTRVNVPTYNIWFTNTRAENLANGRLSVSVPNDFAREWLDTRYTRLVQECVAEVLGEDIKVVFCWSATEEAALSSPQPEVSAPDAAPPAHSHLNPKYTFDSFVIGSSNRFAHAAALAVAEKPSRAYNPLFIYGGVGLGKTHLLQAIGHYVYEIHNTRKIKYVSSEKFTNDFINSIRDKDKIVGFQKKYRYNEVLLVDDIQFLENKEATQEEFFHTFNTLHEESKQIVISSDRRPKEIATLEARLRTRFESGLIVDIQPPDLETRIAILRKRAAAKKIVASNEVLELIADRIKSNIRELEGAITRISAFSKHTKSPITLELTIEVLKDVLPSAESKTVTLAKIKSEACRYYKLTESEITGDKRSRPIVVPRQVAMYLSRELTDASLPKIGAAFGNRDHTTVLHAINKIERLLNEDRDLYNEISEITGRIKGR